MIKLFVTDIDGTLTDGSFINQPGLFNKKKQKDQLITNTQDCKGLYLLYERNIQTMFLTSNPKRKSLKTRAKSLNITHLIETKYQSKLKSLTYFLIINNIDWSEVAYIGDDINDYRCLTFAAYKACPNNAVQKIKEIPNIITMSRNGGHGAVREFIDYLIINKKC